MMIRIINKQRRISIDTGKLCNIIQKILDILDYSDFDIGILLTNNKTISQYNKLYRNKDRATNVLSFSFHPNLKAGERITVTLDEDKNLGDLILSLEYIYHEADALGISFYEHIQNLLVHSICHLLGYDHETESDYRTMRKQENLILKKLKH